MFAGNGMLFPKVMTATPETFSKGFLNGPRPVGRPFSSPTWTAPPHSESRWPKPEMVGHRPLLNSVTYLVLDDAADPALQNNTIDAAGLGSLDELTTAHVTPQASASAGRPARAAPLHLR